MIDFSRNHFELFGLPQQFRFDRAVLDAAYRDLQSGVHPDRVATGDDAQRRAAMQASARVNEAYRALREPVLRAQYLLRLHGIDALDETDTRLPLEFLERQLERREAAGDALAAGDESALAALLESVRAEARDAEDRLARILDDERAWGNARTSVRELMFLDKLALDLDGMLASLDEQ